ncbi:HAD family phosphatase [Candidatus Woesearchaeota archaeon]|nr:HAD family phosphatase [Candidatus Woesearchaeota archaeon]
MPVHKIKAIIFDFDGVIMNSERKKFDQLKRILRGDGVHLRKSHFRKMLGKKTERFLKECFRDRLSQKRISEIIAQRRDALRKHPSEYGTMIADTKKVILRLKSDKKYSLAIATGTEKRIVTVLLKRMKLHDAFKVIITGNDVKESKPNPAVYEEALKRLKVKPANAAVVEDSPAGIRAANSAGIKETVALTTTQSRASLSRAKHIFMYLSQMKNW